MRILRELLRDNRFNFGAAVLLGFAVLVLLSFFSPYDPTEWWVVAREAPPSWEHLLGTNSLGQDVFWRMTFAVRNSLTVAFLAAALVVVIAVTVGLTAGYYGGIVDRVLMLIADGILVIPAFLLLVLVALLLREYMTIMTLALLFGVIGWPWDARLIRSQILSLREREFTYTAILSGTPVRKFIFNEYFPFIIPLVLSTIINNMSWVVGMEITLALIGLTDLGIPTLGTMISWALGYQALLLGFWWWLFTPIVVAILLFIALYLLAVSISQYLDPRARSQRVGAR